MQCCTIPVRIGPGDVQLIHMHWPSPAKPPQFLLHSVWHQEVSPLVPVYV